MSLPEDVLTDQERDALKNAFDRVDLDNDGKIDSGDLKSVFQAMGFTPSDAQVQEVISSADQDGTGSINFDPEFITAVIVLGVKVRVVLLIAYMFAAMDTDGSGYVTKDNIRDLTEQAGVADQVSDAQIDALIASVDTEGDGRVSFEEFIAALAAAE